MLFQPILALDIIIFLSWQNYWGAKRYVCPPNIFIFTPLNFTISNVHLKPQLHSGPLLQKHIFYEDLRASEASELLEIYIFLLIRSEIYVILNILTVQCIRDIAQNALNYE